MSYSEPNIELSDRILLDASCFLSSSTSQNAINVIRDSPSYSYEFPGHLDPRRIDIEPTFLVPKGLQDYINEAESVSRLRNLLAEYYQTVNKRRFPVELEDENELERELREQIFDVYDNSPVLKYFGYRRGLPNFSRLSEVLESEQTEVFSYTDEEISELDISSYQVRRIIPRYRDYDYNERNYITQILTEEAVFLFTQSTLWSRLRKPIDAISDLGAPKFEIRPSVVNQVNIDLDIDIDIDVGPLFQEDGSEESEGTGGGGDDIDDPTKAKVLIMKILALKGFLEQTGVGNWISNVSPLLITALIQEPFLADVLSVPVQLVADP